MSVTISGGDIAVGHAPNFHSQILQVSHAIENLGRESGQIVSAEEPDDIDEIRENGAKKQSVNLHQ